MLLTQLHARTCWPWLVSGMQIGCGWASTSEFLAGRALSQAARWTPRTLKLWGALLLIGLLAYLLACLLAYSLACLCACLITCLLAGLLVCLIARLLACLRARLLTCLQVGVAVGN